MDEVTAIEVHANAPARISANARARLAHVLTQAGAHVTQLRVRLSDAAGQLSGLVLAQANALAAGRRVRVQVTGTTYG